MEAFKFLDKNGESPYSHFFWPLPKGDKPGDWLPEIPELIECKAGYHFTDTKNLLAWLQPRAFLFEPAGKVEQYNNKYASTGGRLIKELSFPPKDGRIALGSVLALLREFDEEVDSNLHSLYGGNCSRRAYPYKYTNVYSIFRDIETELLNDRPYKPSDTVHQTLSFSGMTPYPGSLPKHLHAFRLMSEIEPYHHIEYSRHLLKCLIALRDTLSGSSRYLEQRCFSSQRYVFDSNLHLHPLVGSLDSPVLPEMKYSVPAIRDTREILGAIVSKTSYRFNDILASLFNVSLRSFTNGEKQ